MARIKVTIEKELGLILYEERISRKMDITDFSEFLDISHATYSNLERDKGTYSEDLIKKIEKKLKIKLLD